MFAGFALAQNRVFEMRTYTCYEGKLEALKTRFRDHTIRIFKSHGMESIGYWVPQDDGQKTTLIYIIAAHQPRAGHEELGGVPHRSGMEEGRRRFRKGRQNRRQAARSVFMDPADFSKFK